MYKAQCQTEDFISQIEQWDEVAALSDAQYQRLITNPMIPECIERHLGRNDHYWEAYWESVSEAAHGLVRQASKQPDCFTPEAEIHTRFALARANQSAMIAACICI